ncbi:MAG: OmpA family protein [Polyangia bacterium]
MRLLRLPVALSMGIAASCFLAGGEARAESKSFDIDHMQLALTRSTFIATEGGDAPPRWDYRVAAAFGFIQSPLVLERDGQRIEVISSRATVALQGAVQFGKWVGLGFELPLVVGDSGSPDVAHGAALGDVRLAPRVELLHKGRVGLAALLDLRVPTGARGRLIGEGMVVFEPRLALQVKLGKLDLGTNVGVRIRQERTYLDLRVGNEAFLTLAAAYTPRPWITAVLELHGDTALNTTFATTQRSPLELITGVFGQWQSLRAGLSAGFGLVEGFGSPRARVVASVEYRLWNPPPPPPPEVTIIPVPPVKRRPPPLEQPKAEEMTFDPEEPPTEPPPEITTSEPDIAVHRGRIELADPIFFDKDRRRIHHRYFPELEQLARVLKRRLDFTTIWIEGHADNTGPVRWNLELSRNRADSVAQFLTSHGIAASRLKAVGYGEARPLVPSPRGESNEKNRRVHFFTDTETTRITPVPQTPPAPEVAPDPVPSEESGEPPSAADILLGKEPGK